MKRRSGLFLMEIIIVLLFFSVCAAICVNLFAKSALMADKAHRTENAVLMAQSAAAVYKSTGGDIGETAEKLGGASLGGISFDSETAVYGDDNISSVFAGTPISDGAAVFYGDDCELIAPGGESEYTLLIIPQDRQYSHAATITVAYHDGTELFSMTAAATGGDAQ